MYPKQANVLGRKSVQSSGGSGGDLDDRPLYNLRQCLLFTMILYNSENSIRDIRPFCRPLFCHSSVVKYTSSLLQ